MTIKIYISQHCTPCQEVRDLIEQGKYEDEIELVDIETDEGFETFSREVLEHGNGAVPSAYKEGAKCKILIDEGQGLMFECPVKQGNPQLEDQNKGNSV